METNIENTVDASVEVPRLVRPHRIYRDEDLRQNALTQFKDLGIQVPTIRQIGMFWLRWVGDGEMPPKLPYPDGPGWPQNCGKLEPYHSHEWESMGQHSHDAISTKEALWVWMCEDTVRAEWGINAVGLASTTDQRTLDSWIDLPDGWIRANSRVSPHE
jgi:hypothetical protein